MFPPLRGNRISKNGYEVIRIHRGGRSVFEGKDLRDNTKRAWNVDATADPRSAALIRNVEVDFGEMALQLIGRNGHDLEKHR